MKQLNSKIIKTILLTLGIVWVLALAIRFFYGLFIMDDDLMFICSLSLMTIASTMFLVILFSSNIASMWAKKKSKQNKNNEDASSEK